VSSCPHHPENRRKLLIMRAKRDFHRFFAVFGGTGGIASRDAPEATLTQGMQKVECRMQKIGLKPP
jgi:hypothetical protein